MTTRRLFVSSFAAILVTAGAAVAQPFGPPGGPPGGPPPEPRFERVPDGRRGYAWENGHWHWDGRQYVWFRGRYVPARAEYHQYVPGHWDRRGPGWVWIGAHWE